MPEGRPPISSARIATGDIARHSFAIVRRGFDTDEVRAYLQSVARSLEGLEEREQELRTALAEAEERAAHPVVDEATLTTSLGQHSAQILRHAHEEAARIVAPGPGRGGHAPARDPEPGRRTAGAHRGRRPPNASSRWSCWWPAQNRRPAWTVSGSSPKRWHRPRRSSPGPRTRGGRSSNRSKRPGAGCWPIWPRDDAPSGSRSSNCAPPGTRWPRRCTACATRWRGSWATWSRTDEEARAAAAAVADNFRVHGASDGPLRPGRAGGRGDGATDGTGVHRERARGRGRAGGGRGRGVGQHALGRRAVRTHPGRDQRRLRRRPRSRWPSLPATARRAEAARGSRRQKRSGRERSEDPSPSPCAGPTTHSSPGATSC